MELDTFGWEEGHNTWIITAYSLCKNKKVNLGTSYQHQRHYFTTKKKDLTCPHILFLKHLIKQIKQWHAAGERNILFMDHNKHIIEGNFGQELADKEGLDLQKAILHHTGISQEWRSLEAQGLLIACGYQATLIWATRVLCYLDMVQATIMHSSLISQLNLWWEWIQWK